MKIDYDEISPITGNKCVIVEADENTNVESRICMESGYSTADTLKTDSKTIETYEQSLTQFMRDKKFVDEDSGLVWYPSFMQLPGGMLYCDEIDNSELQWKVAGVVEISDEDRKQYPVPGKSDEYYTSRLDVDNAKTYDKYDFETALDDLYAMVKKVYNED